MYYMTTPLSIRFDAALLTRLRRRAGATAGSTTSALAQRLIDEGLRMADHPGVIFKDGPSGRRAASPTGQTSGKSSSSCVKSTSAAQPR